MFRRGKEPKRHNKPRVTTVTHLFHGVEIISGDPACASVRAQAGMRVLSDDAPTLPLDNCEFHTSCTCKYKHYADRRTELRREADAGLPPRMSNHDRRLGSGRRITDK